MTVLPLLCEATALCTAPLMTEIKMAAPKRWKKCRLTFPARPERPSSSVPGELKGMTTPVGVRASDQSTKTRAAPWVTPPRVSPTSFVPRSRRTVEPSALKVSVAVMHVVIPGNVESSAVSRVQSMKAPFGSKSRCVGNTCARTAGVRLGLNNSCSGPLPVPAASRSPTGPLGDPTSVALELSGEGVAVAESLLLRRENAGPANRRYKAISADDLRVGCDAPPTGDATPARASLGLWVIGGSSGAGPKIFP